MEKIQILLITVVSALFFAGFAGCENSQPKKTADNPTPEMQAASTGDATGRTIRPPSAQKAPDFTLTDIKGKPLKLSDYKGKVIILDFWAAWCHYCKIEIPFFIELKQQYEKDGLAIIGIALDDLSKIKAYYKDNGMNYQVAIDNQQVSMSYGGIQGLPTTFIIDRDGYIRETFVGYRPKEVFEQTFLSLK